VLQLAQLDLAENLSSHHSHDSALVEASDVQSSSDDIQASFEKPASLKKKRNRANRACKGKRLRYHRFVTRVCSQIDKDPASFNIGNVVLPPSLAAIPKKLFFLSATGASVPAASVGSLLGFECSPRQLVSQVVQEELFNCLMTGQW